MYSKIAYFWKNLFFFSYFNQERALVYYSSREFSNIFTKHKNVDKKILNLKKEELLCEKLGQFPVLFDKSHKGYKEKVALENAWNEVADGLDFIENGIWKFILFSFDLLFKPEYNVMK